MLVDVRFWPVSDGRKTTLCRRQDFSEADGHAANDGGLRRAPVRLWRSASSSSLTIVIVKIDIDADPPDADLLRLFDLDALQ